MSPEEVTWSVIAAAVGGSLLTHAYQAASRRVGSLFEKASSVWKLEAERDKMRKERDEAIEEAARLRIARPYR